jgi:hypothetical protein
MLLLPMQIWTAELDLGDHAEFSSWPLLDFSLLFCILAPWIFGCVRVVDLDDVEFFCWYHRWKSWRIPPG